MESLAWKIVELESFELESPKLESLCLSLKLYPNPYFTRTLISPWPLFHPNLNCKLTITSPLFHYNVRHYHNRVRQRRSPSHWSAKSIRQIGRQMAFTLQLRVNFKLSNFDLSNLTFEQHVSPQMTRSRNCLEKNAHEKMLTKNAHESWKLWTSISLVSHASSLPWL